MNEQLIARLWTAKVPRTRQEYTEVDRLHSDLVKSPFSHYAPAVAYLLFQSNVR